MKWCTGSCVTNVVTIITNIVLKWLLVIHTIALSLYRALSLDSLWGCGCSVWGGGRAPDEAVKGSTAVLSLWLTAPTPPSPIMNNGTQKYIYLLIAPAPCLWVFSLAQTTTVQCWGFENRHPSPCHPTRDCLCSFWSWALLSVLEMGNQAWFWKGQAIFEGAVNPKFDCGGLHSWSLLEVVYFHPIYSESRLDILCRVKADYII